MSDYETPGRGSSRDFADKAVQAGFKVADAAGTAVGHLQETGEQLRSQGAQIADDMQQVAGHFSKALDRSLADKPMATLGMAAIMGFVVGAIWKA